jgi:hypothetical protein
MAAKDTPSFGSDTTDPKPDDDLAKRVEDLEARLAAAQAAAPLTLIPVHAGGPGMEIAETWSQADQEAARTA